jgi:hypothetical protein
MGQHGGCFDVSVRKSISRLATCLVWANGAAGWPCAECAGEARASAKVSAGAPAFHIDRAQPVCCANSEPEKARCFRTIAWTNPTASATQIHKLIQITEAAPVA